MDLSNDDKKFLSDFDMQVKNTIDKFNLINDDDRLFVAVSGGKDSSVLLYILKKLGYKVEAITVDVLIGKYTKKNLENIRIFCKDLEIKLHEISFRDTFGYSLCYITSALKQNGLNLNSCSVCGTLRRYLINKKVRELKATKVALGHNMDDEAENIIMNYLKNRLSLSARLGPMGGMIKHSSFVSRIKPLYFIQNFEAERYSKIMNFPVEYGICPCSVDAFRRSIRDNLKIYEKKHPGTIKNIVTHFLSTLDDLKKEFKNDSSQKFCLECGEPSAGSVCRTCQLISNARC